MIDFFYLGDYHENRLHATATSTVDVPAFSITAGMYALADKYDVRALQSLSLDKFRTSLRACKGTSFEFSHLLQAISAVYKATTDTDRTLRDIVLVQARQNWKNFSARKDFKDFMLQEPEFTVDLVLKTMQQPCSIVCTRCKATDKWQADHVKCACGRGEKI